MVVETRPHEPGAAPEPQPGRRLPLEGIRIIDATQWWAGPMGMTLLADLGAEVVKLESIQHPDPGRMSGAMLGGYGSDNQRMYEKCAAFIWMNRNKYDVTLNLREAEGVALFKELVRTADMVAENLRPGVFEQFGLGWEQLRELNPSLIMLSLPGYGVTGPWKDYASYASPVEQMAGFSHITGYADGDPMTHRPWQDEAVGLHGALGALLALWHRKRTGEGQYIDLAQTEAVTTMNMLPLMDFALNQRVRGRRGNQRDGWAPHDYYRAAGEDAWVAIAVGSDEEWHQLCELMGQPELATDARFATHEARAQRPQELRAAIEPWTSARDGHETADALAALGIAGGAFSDPWTMVDDPQIRARGLMERVERAHVGEQAYPGAFLRISGHPFGAQRPAPTLGEHNRLVFGDWLGVSEDRLSELAASGVIGDTPLGQ